VVALARASWNNHRANRAEKAQFPSLGPAHNSRPINTRSRLAMASSTFKVGQYLKGKSGIYTITKSLYPTIWLAT
jgi:hypothetical protein